MTLSASSSDLSPQESATAATISGLRATARCFAKGHGYWVNVSTKRSIVNLNCHPTLFFLVLSKCVAPLISRPVCADCARFQKLMENSLIRYFTVAQKTKFSTFGGIMIPYVAGSFTCFVLSQFVNPLFGLIPCCALLTTNAMLRLHVAKMYNIRANGPCVECMIGCCCCCCSLSQSEFTAPHRNFFCCE